MVKWLTKISIGKLVLCGIIYTVVAMIIRNVEAILTMKYYVMPEYFGVWSKLMMPSAGPPPASFIITSLIMSFVSGVSLGLVYYYIRDMLPKEFAKRVFFFADLTVGLQFVFFTLPVYLMFNVPVGLLISWFISSFMILLAVSYTFVRIIK